MKYPFTVGMARQFVSVVDEVAPYAHALAVGKSKNGRDLPVVEIADLESGVTDKSPCVLIYAREHADEHDSSWVADGAARFLLSDAEEAKWARSQAIFLIIPVLDPDAAASETHEGIIDTFTPDNWSLESREYANFFKRWIDSGHRLDVVVDLHCVESAEGPHLFSPLASPVPAEFAATSEILATLERRLVAEGYIVKGLPGSKGTTPTRLGGWLNETFGSLFTPYEVNSQEPQRHLSVAELRRLGEHIAVETTAFFGTQKGKDWLRCVDEFGIKRREHWTKFGAQVGSNEALDSEQAVRWKARSDELRSNWHDRFPSTEVDK